MEADRVVRRTWRPSPGKDRRSSQATSEAHQDQNSRRVLVRSGAGMTRLPPLIYWMSLRGYVRLASCSIIRPRGSHEIWYNPATHRRTTVPNHPGTIPRGTLHAIIREAGLSVDEFVLNLLPSALSTSLPPRRVAWDDRMVVLVERTAAGGSDPTRQIDRLVDELYELTDEEIAVVEGEKKPSRFRRHEAGSRHGKERLRGMM